MTTPKVKTIKRGVSRFYVEPETGAKVPGVTSILGMLPKGFLKYWAAKMVAEEAVAATVDGTLPKLAERNPEGAIDYLKRSPDRNTRDAANIGTYAHDIFERLAKGESIGPVADELEPYVRHYSEFLDVVQPEFQFMEETVWSDTHSYAGSFDAYAVIQGERVWIDNKTTRSGVHAEVGVQLAAYRFADHIVRPDGGRVPMPKADGGAVVHIRPEGWALVPVRADRVLFDDVFLPLRKVFDYDRELSKGIVGAPVAHGPNEKAHVGKTGGPLNKPKARA